MPLNVVWCIAIAAGLTGAIFCGASSVDAAAPSPEPIVVAHGRLDAYSQTRTTPPALFAQTIMPTSATPIAVTPTALFPATPTLAMQSFPASAVVGQSGVVRLVTPGGTQPSVLWVIAMGVVCCRLGARVVRMS